MPRAKYDYEPVRVDRSHIVPTFILHTDSFVGCSSVSSTDDYIRGLNIVASVKKKKKEKKEKVVNSLKVIYSIKAELVT